MASLVQGEVPHSEPVPELTFQPYGDCSAAPDQGVSTPFPALKPFQFSFWTGQPEGLSGVSGQTVSDNGASSIAGDLAEYSSSALRPGQREPS